MFGATEAREVADAEEGLVLVARRNGNPLDGSLQTTFQLRVAIGRDVDQVPGTVDEPGPTDNAKLFRLNHLAITPQRQAGQLAERLAALDGLNDVHEGQLALAQTNRIVHASLKLQLGCTACEPTADHLGKIRVCRVHGLRAAVRVRHLIAEDPGRPIQQRPLAGFDHATLCLLLRIQVAVDQDDLVSSLVGQASDHQQRER